MRPASRSSSAMSRVVGPRGRPGDLGRANSGSARPAPATPGWPSGPPVTDPPRTELDAIRALSAWSPRTLASSETCISRSRAISRLCASSILVRSAASFRSFVVASSAMSACLSNSAWNLAACDCSSNCSTPAVSSAATASSPLPPTWVPCDRCCILRASRASSSSRSALPAAALTASLSLRTDSRSRCSRWRWIRNFSACAVSRGVGPRDSNSSR
mmetsp:Transcript_11112/g.51479  ORF Transcript_11112/g.51479 Transcript_11112/m.51479 type:complete len:216 (+) Transcript_11112:4745-5392(+)